METSECALGEECGGSHEYDEEDDRVFAAFVSMRCANIETMPHYQRIFALDEATESTDWAKLMKVDARGLNLLRVWGNDDQSEHIVENSIVLTGVQVWPASIALSGYLKHHATSFGPSGFHGKNALELGSGTGIAGISLALLGASVTLTDSQRQSTSLLVRNIHENHVSMLCSVRYFKWGYDLSSLGLNTDDKLDLIIAADAVYGGMDGSDLLQVGLEVQ